jgi:hypothetical protein
MNKDEFIETVRQMRAAQKSYFKEGRKRSDLIESKRLEKMVDDALAESNPQAGPESTEQPTLFNKGD